MADQLKRETFHYENQPYGYYKLTDVTWTPYPDRPNMGSVEGTVVETNWCGAFFGGVAVGRSRQDEVGTKKSFGEVCQIEFENGKKFRIAM